jgi:hypothetical protein
MTFLEAQKALCRKLNISYTDIAYNDLFSLDDLKEWLNMGTLKAWDYKPWDFAEGAKNFNTIDADYFDYPEDVVTGGIKFITIGGEEYYKITYEDYRKYLTDDPTGTDKVWSEYKRFIFINKNAYTVGDECVVYGKLKAEPLVNDADLLPFSPDSDNEEYSGNQSIVLFAYAEALDSEKLNKANQSVIQEKKALQILDILWKPFAEARALQKSKDRPFFNIPDYYGKTNNITGNF